MSKVIIAGHGGFGTAIKNALSMLLGETEGMIPVDFNQEDDLTTLIKKLKAAVEECGGDEILFACDITGGSPFRQSAILCLDDARHRAVAGINLSGFAELVYNLDMTAAELLDTAIETTRATIIQFPQSEEE